MIADVGLRDVAARGLAFAGTLWEIYGDPNPDEPKNQTRIAYAITRGA